MRPRLIVIALALAAGSAIAASADDARLVAAIRARLSDFVTVFFLPIWTGAVIPYSAWHARMWRRSYKRGRS